MSLHAAVASILCLRSQDLRDVGRDSPRFSHLGALRSPAGPSEFPLQPSRQAQAGLAAAGRAAHRAAAGASLSACCPLESAAPKCTSAKNQTEFPSSQRQAPFARPRIPPAAAGAAVQGDFVGERKKSLLCREPWASPSDPLPRRRHLAPARFPETRQIRSLKAEARTLCASTSFGTAGLAGAQGSWCCLPPHVRGFADS